MCDCVWATLKWGLKDAVIDHPKQVLTKMACFHVQLTIQGLIWREKSVNLKPVHLEKKGFYRITMERKDELYERWAHCSGFLKNWQSHSGTVEGSYACFVHCLICLNLLYFSNFNRTEKQRNMSFFLFISLCSLLNSLCVQNPPSLSGGGWWRLLRGLNVSPDPLANSCRTLL